MKRRSDDRGMTDRIVVEYALTSDRTTEVEKWEQTYFASTIQKKRAKFYRQIPLKEDEIIIRTDGTENGTYSIVYFEPETG